MDPQLVIDQQAEFLRKRIAELEQQMVFRGMSDNFYFTNGKRDADQAFLRELSKELESLK